MFRVTLQAGCKINLHLDILSRRDDGYHELRTLFYPLSEPHDTLTLRPGDPGSGLTLTCSTPELASESNIVHKAWRRFGEATGWLPDLELHLEKRIPSGAGLGGGSSDAAALLRRLNAAAGDRALHWEALVALAAGLGADVPFFLLHGPAWATGIGEDLRPCSVDLFGMWLVLALPSVEVSTAWAYGAWDAAHQDDPVEEKSLLTARNHAAILSRSNALWLYNGFERVVFAAHPELRRIKESLMRFGSCGALMSGSGSALFALYRSKAPAEEAAQSLATAGVAHCMQELRAF